MRPNDGIVQYCRTNTYQTTIFQGAAVDHRVVAYRDIITNECGDAFIHVNDCPILNIAAGADTDQVVICS